MTSVSNEKQSFNLSRWAIAHPSIARFLFGLIIIAGVLGLTHMGQKEDPDFTFRVMVVQVMWPGASIDDMQDQVVNKIERKLQETPHLDFVRSYTRAGSAIITVQVKGDTNAAEVNGRLLSGAQEGRRHLRRTAGRTARAPTSTMNSATPSSRCTPSAATATAIRS